MPEAPRWSLADAVVATTSVDLTHEVGFTAGTPVVVLDIDAGDDPARWDEVVGRLAQLAVVTVAERGPADACGPVDELVTAVLAHPQAACTTALHLRTLPDEPLAAIHQESLAYAALQSGAEHRRWLDGQGRRTRNDDAPRVRIDAARITLTRPRLHNLLDRRGRDELAHAFRLMALSTPTGTIRWQAEGTSFCAGGDPAEFGTVADPATAHLVRAAASPAPALVPIAARVRTDVHGACVGAGIELAAFTGHVSAHPDTTFRLPELSMGLMPGVGGTWSITRRIGRRRLLQWLLLDLDVDAGTALEWRLVDEIAGPAAE